MTADGNRIAQAEAHLAAGIALIEEGALGPARERLEAALGLTPAWAQVHFHLGRAQVRAGDLAAGERSARAALEHNPRHPGAAHLLGAILSESDRLPEAISWLRAGAAGAPQSAQMMRDLGVAELFLGELDPARQHLSRALELDADSNEVLFSLVGMTAMGEDTPASKWLFNLLDERAASMESLSETRRGELLFALAKAHEDRCDYDKAFAFLERANDSRRSEIVYDGRNHAWRLKRVMKIFDAEYIARLSGGGVPSQRPIFIVGVPRSGTTLVEQIISAHPVVHGAGEPAIWPTLVIGSKGKNGTVYPEWLPTMNAADCVSFGEAYLERAPTGAAGKLKTTDKRLENFEFLGLIHVTLPAATMIHVHRDPRDACFSCYAMRFSDGQQWAYDLAEVGRFWRMQKEVMDHWRRVLPPGKILDVSYEALVRDPEGESRRIIAHCGLEWDEACLRFHESRRPVRSASVVQVRQPIYDTSIGRWKPFEKHLGPMFEAMGLGGGDGD